MKNEIPEVGFMRLSQIIGQKAISPEQAIANKKRGVGPRMPRPAIPPIIPVGKSTWWAGVKNGRFPEPVKLSERCTAWRAEDIRALIVSGQG